jgi:predicted Zn-dependent peptidase
MVVAVAGNIDHATVVRLVRKAYDSRLDGCAVAVRTRPDRRRSYQPASEVHVVPDDTEQANIVLGTFGMSRFDERRWVLAVLSTAIGGGMSSRLFQEVREKRGLAYSTYSYTSVYAGEGIFGLYAGCQPGKADEVISIMELILNEAAHGGLAADEVVRAKGQLSGSMVLGLEDSCSRMTRIGKAELNYGDVMGIDELLFEVNAVTVQQVNELADELANQPRCLTVVGPFEARDFTIGL